MNMKNYTKLRVAYMLMLFLFITHIFSGFSSAPPLGRTGAPGDGRCTDCHGGNNPLGFDGSLQILGLPTEVTPSTTYRVTVEVANPNGLSQRAGMQMVALRSDNTAAGTFSNPSSGGAVTVNNNNGRNYLGHSPAQGYDSNRIVTWEVDWTTPADLDPNVTFYAAGNIANGSGTSNDLILFETQSTEIIEPMMELPDLFASNVNGFEGTFAPDDVVEFTWDLHNNSTEVATESYRVAMFLSDDSQFSADDPFVGEVPTGNTFPGVISDVPGAIRVPAVTPDGDYFLHFLVDADGVIEESDEDNNLLTTSSTITVMTPVLDNVVVSLSSELTCQASVILTANASGGAMDFSYLWTTQETTQSIEVFEDGTYTVTVTDSNGTSASRSITLDIPVILSASENIIQQPSGSQQGIVEIIPEGGTAPFAYQWPDGTTTATNSNLSAGAFTVTVTDGNGCTTTVDFVLNTLPEIMLTSTVTQLTCSDSADASIEVVATGGTGNYSYLWSTQETSSGIANLTAGPYSVTVSDGASEDAITSFIITAIEPISLVEDVTDVLCNGDETGAISVLAVGGTGPYQYSWSNGVSTNNNEGLLAGSYSVIVTDTNGCTFVQEFVIEEPTALMVDIIVSGDECFGSSPFVTVNASGGVPPYDISSTVEPGSNVVTIDVIDANGCRLIEVFELDLPEQIIIQGNILNVRCFDEANEANGAIELTSITGGTPPYTFDWDNGFTSNSIVGLTAGLYTVIVSDANGCMSVTTFEVSEPDELSLSSSIVDEGTGAGSIDIEVDGGIPPYTYLWSNGEVTQDIFNLSAGDFTVFVTDANDCELMEDFSLVSTSVATISELSDVSIYPTLTQNILNVELSFSKAVDISTSLFSLDGTYQKILTPDFIARAGTQKNQIDVSHLESGIYLLVIQNEEGIVVERFVKL